MRRSILAIVAGLILAVLAAAAVAKLSGLPFAEAHTGELPIWHFIRTAMPIAAFALPGALTAILLAETRRVRGLLFWILVGLLLAVLAFLTLNSSSGGLRDTFLNGASFVRLAAMGAVGGYVYWVLVGKKSGHVLTALEHASRGEGLDERGLRRRCRMCGLGALLLGLLPLALLGWHMMYRTTPMLPASIAAKAEIDGTRTLADAGLAASKLTIDNHIGHVTGTAPDETARNGMFDTAKKVLAPMVGLPGVVAVLQNDIAVSGTEKPALPAVTTPSRDELAAKANAEEVARLADEAKRKAEEMRLAEEAKRKAEELRLADEAKRKAEELRLADEAKRKAADEDARLAAEAKQRAEDQKRLDDELAAQKKADEAVRVAAEAEAERKAVEAAHKAEAEKLAAEAEAKRQADAQAAAKKLAEAQEKTVAMQTPVLAPAPAPQAVAPLPAPDSQCPGDFSDLFKSGNVRFGLRSAEIDSASAEFLDRVAAVAKRCAEYSLSIGGHADRTGAESYNKQLSFNRAVAVQDALVARGIAAERLEPEGYSSQQPLDGSNVRSAFALNRRVDIVASLTPADKTPAKGTDAAPGAGAARPSEVLPALTIDQCNSEFSRAFLADTVRFIGSSADIDGSYAAYLDRIAALALSCPYHKLVLGGHTDRSGSAAFNQRLSDARANAVRGALMDRKVPEGRISAAGYGGERPYDPGSSPEAFALNRRVDFGVAVQAH
jgi:outer membrane protein OmpA-like peptidoglycan-associated protein